jgi:3-oxoadipate enol-lactonase
MQAGINGTTLEYRIDGPADDETAPWLTFSNSLVTTLDMWAPQVAHFAGRYRILRYDIRGHGSSAAAPPPYTPDMLAADVVDLLDHLGIPRTHIAGISVGGMTAIMAAAAYPQRIATLTVSNLSAQATQAVVAGWESRIAQVEAEGMSSIVEPMLARWFTPDWRAANPETEAQVRALIAPTTLTGFVGGGRALQQVDYTGKGAAIRCPTLFIGGADDDAAPTSAMREVAATFADARLIEIAGAGHLSNLQRPDAWNQALDMFLDAHGQP